MAHQFYIMQKPQRPLSAEAQQANTQNEGMLPFNDEREVTVRLETDDFGAYDVRKANALSLSKLIVGRRSRFGFGPT